MAQADANITTSRFHNLSNEALADVQQIQRDAANDRRWSC